MTIGADVLAKITQTNAEPVASTSINSEWSKVRDQTETLDASAITNPTAQITASDCHDFVSNGAGGTAGTHLVPQWRWDQAKTPTQAPEVVAFGRTDDATPEQWVQLRTRAGNLTWTPSFASGTYTTDGTYNYTIPTLTTDPFDRMGCNRVRFGLQKDGQYSGGDGAAGAIYAKPI